MRPGRFPGLVIALAGALVLGMWLGGHPENLPGPLRDAFVDDRGRLAAEALGLIEERYWREIDADQLEERSVRAMMRNLRREHDDRFTHYFDEDAYERFRDVTEGAFSGVGLTVNQVPRGLRVASVIEDTPAAEAGISEGDLIVAVDGESIAGESAELATSRIRGEAGTEVGVTVLDPESGERREVELRRERVQVPVVEGRMIRAAGSPVAYVRLLSFTAGAHAQLRREIARLDDEGAEGLILDLRGNGGGLLTEAIATSSLFVGDGVIVSTRSRVDGDRDFRATGGALEERPTVILVNGDTASAAEILAAALQERGLATLVGEQTFGKGTFQEVIPLGAGGALDLTVGEFVTSRGTSLASRGIEPEVGARDRPATAVDEGLRAAQRTLAAELP